MFGQFRVRTEETTHFEAKYKFKKFKLFLNLIHIVCFNVSDYG